LNLKNKKEFRGLLIIQQMLPSFAG